MFKLLIIFIFNSVLYSSPVCFVAKNPAPLEHFQVFVKTLESEGISAKIVDMEELWKENPELVITETGHGDPSFIQLHRTLEEKKIRHLIYYENLEKHVPGGYSAGFNEILKENLGGIIFANCHLINEFETPHKKIGLGYFPFDYVDKLKEMRHCTKRDGKTFVYLGGASSFFFETVFPHFLQTIEESTLEAATIIFQPHPRGKLHGYYHLPRDNQFIISEQPLMESLAQADFVLYYQTTVVPKCLLANMAVIQIAEKPYEDLLVRSGIIRSVATAEEFDQARKNPLTEGSILEAIGYDENWKTNLLNIVKEKDV